MELSFWENNSLTEFDFVIVGAGITGLSTALAIRDKEPNSKIAVLERGILPSGASTKNAGFACFGSLSEIIADIKHMGIETSAELVARRWHGLRKLRERVGDESLEYHNYGGYELLMESQVSAIQHMEEINSALEPIFGKQVFASCDEKIQSFEFNDALVKAMVFNEFEGQLNTGSMMESLYYLAICNKISVFTGATVSDILDHGSEVALDVSNGVSKITLKARKIGICSNAFAPKLIPELDVQPGRGQVLVTQPIEGLPFKGTFHAEEGYYYFRNFNNRVIFGGGRNTEFEKETTDEFGNNEKIREHLKEMLHTLIFPKRAVDIDYFWSGIMAFGPTKEPILKKHSKNIALGVRLGGMGVAIGTLVGDMVAELMLE